MADTQQFVFSTFPTLTTDRLVLREVQVADAPDVLIFRGDPEVQKYNAVPMVDEQEVRTFIEQMRTECAALERQMWGITLQGQNTVIGMVGMRDWDQYHRRTEVGYDLARAHWGQGIGTEAVRAVVQFGFERMNLHRIEAGTIADNFGSVRLLEKVGFIREGTRRESSWEEDGRYHDSAMYGILKKDFLAE